MSRKYYVVGFRDTGREFEIRGVTTSKKKAEEFKKKLADGLFQNSRCWAEINEVDGIK